MNYIAYVAFGFVITFNAQAAQPAAFAVSPDQKARPAMIKTSPMTQSLKGKVLETLNAASYTYLKLSTPEGETWAAIPQTSIKVGSEVGIDNPMKMDGFESKALKRKFDKIVFGTLSGSPVSSGASSGNIPNSMFDGRADRKGLKTMDPHGAKPSGPIDLKSVKVEKASGSNAKTIEEVFTEKTKLNGKKISLRGKVVKVNLSIMNKNWIHLRDGSGSVEAGNFDLIVTSQSSPQVGDVVEVEGTVAADRDIGAGYKYPVLVENAKILKR